MFCVFWASTLCVAAPNINMPSVNTLDFSTPSFDVLETDMASVFASIQGACLNSVNIGGNVGGNTDGI